MKTYKEIIAENNQEHLLKYIEMADAKQKENLINQIESLDFDKLKKLYQISTESKPISTSKIEHIHYTDKYKLSNDDFYNLNSIGENIIKNNQYVLTMAGGQGTRQ